MLSRRYTYQIFMLTSNKLTMPLFRSVCKTCNQFSSNAVEFVGNAKALSKDLWATQ
jgi:hypothetical protein